MKKVNKYIGIIAAGMALCAMPSCTDTWDEHYGGGEGVTATKSLWEQIEANPELSRFAEIAKSTVYYKDPKHALTNQNTGQPFTYKDVFSGTQIMTVWAPENSSMTEEEWNKWLALAETNPYILHQQFMGNCTALWRNNISNNNVDTLEMINGKKMVFDRGSLTMRGVKINQQNIAATNGTMHTLMGNIPFEYNIYEFMKDASCAQQYNINIFDNYVIARDTTYFVESLSIQGPPNIDGHPTYVDSVYLNTNTMFLSRQRLTTSNPDRNLTFMESFGANIESEDSDFVMVIPTDVAWQAAYEKLKPLYNYATSYIDNVKGTSSEDDSKLEPREIDAEQMDSFIKLNIEQDIISPLCFNARRQPKLSPSSKLWTSSTLLAAPESQLKYYINTYGDTLRTDDQWSKKAMLEGTEISMSNGKCIIADNWNIPFKYYQPDVNVEVNAYNVYGMNNFLLSGYYKPYTNAIPYDKIPLVGSTTNNDFVRFWSSDPNGSPDIEFRLVGSHSNQELSECEVMSGSYDVYVVLVPNYFMDATTDLDNLSVNDYVRHKFNATLSYQDLRSGKIRTQTKKSDDFLYAGEKVEAIKVFENFKFPYSYKNLRYSYPTIKLSTKDFKSKEMEQFNNEGQFAANELVIDRIILVSKQQ